jgi:hypothetical protein
MKRKFNGAAPVETAPVGPAPVETVPVGPSLEEMVALIGHLSPTVRVGEGGPQPWTAIRIVVANACIEWVDNGRDWSSTVTRLQTTVSRYQRRVDDIQMVFDMMSRPSSTITMEDGTCTTGVSGDCWSKGYRLFYVSLLPTAGKVWYPDDLIQQVYLGDVEQVKCMVESGVDINSRTGGSDDNTALGMAMLGKYDDGPEMIQYLSSLSDIDTKDTDRDGNTVLHRVIKRIGLHRLPGILRGGVDAHVQNMFGQNVLHVLVQSCALDCYTGNKVLLLLEYGSGTLMMCLDSEGCLPLDVGNRQCDASWEVGMSRANSLKLTTMRELTDVLLSFVPVSALITLILGYFTYSSR